mmetsp:Transcript_16458/g.22977  ORF Transcript_16458/g.22977 Transcript_16458/m.22977 type:complete len:471 (+) Transcript_16458:29-1441(+)|eukprot:CAMPEP_0184482346 /NCGR_PEP_ID=MMETSP0113_2-20130426/3906_1 /TAXON_ID=91329 /ORGANISM="Norrisiella sphaerica, Strain BC52" /LENGTH=470 /DNA_ID=CAMNT_0026862015 /DNA_START=25 /DNA_END=1437 /DNA_ORIENTATION=-
MEPVRALEMVQEAPFIPTGTSCTNKICRKQIDETSILKIVGEKSLIFCRKCAISYDNDRFCARCHQIYRQQDSDGFDGKEWLECSECLRWTHVECEVSCGFSQAPSLYSEYKENGEVLYLCPHCRGDFEAETKISATTLEESVSDANTFETQRDLLAELIRCQGLQGVFFRHHSHEMDNGLDPNFAAGTPPRIDVTTSSSRVSHRMEINSRSSSPTLNDPNSKSASPSSSTSDLITAPSTKRANTYEDLKGYRFRDILSDSRTSKRKRGDCYPSVLQSETQSSTDKRQRIIDAKIPPPETSKPALGLIDALLSDVKALCEIQQEGESAAEKDVKGLNLAPNINQKSSKPSKFDRFVSCVADLSSEFLPGIRLASDLNLYALFHSMMTTSGEKNVAFWHMVASKMGVRANTDELKERLHGCIKKYEKIMDDEHDPGSRKDNLDGVKIQRRENGVIKILCDFLPQTSAKKEE